MYPLVQLIHTQRHFQNAKQAASDLTFGKDVTVQTHGRDKYKRTLAEVLLPDGMNLNQELVKQAGGIGDMRLATRSWRS